jgi:hypothetical protein
VVASHDRGFLEDIGVERVLDLANPDAEARRA